MAINADKPARWKDDIQTSVDQFNRWFMKFAPKAFRDARVQTTKDVEQALKLTRDLTAIDPATLSAHPQILPTLRMAACPPLARDRLMGLAYVSKSLVGRMEAGTIPPRMAGAQFKQSLARIVRIVAKMVDTDIFPWIS